MFKAYREGHGTTEFCKKVDKGLFQSTKVLEFLKHHKKRSRYALLEGVIVKHLFHPDSGPGVPIVKWWKPYIWEYKEYHIDWPMVPIQNWPHQGPGSWVQLILSFLLVCIWKKYSYISLTIYENVDMQPWLWRLSAILYGANVQDVADTRKIWWG